MIRSAISGCGAISRVHITALKKRDDTVICAVCDNNPEAAQKLLDEMEISCKIYTDYDEMLEKEKLDFVHICTPHFLHVPQSIKALEHGINVLCEKPICMNIREFEMLEEAEKKSSAELCVCFQNRFLKANTYLQSLIDSKEYGELLGMRGIVSWDRHGDYYTKSSWRGKKGTEGGSVLMNQAIHTLDLMVKFGGKVLSSEGSCANHHMKGVNDTEDTAEMYIKFQNGAVGIFYATTAYIASLPITLDVSFEKTRFTLEGSRLLMKGEEIIPKDDGGIVGKAVWGTGHEKLIEKYYTERKSPVPLSSVKDTMTTIWNIYKQNQ